MKLIKSLQAWKTKAFLDIFKQEISTLDARLLPLQQGLTYSSYAITNNLSVSILKVTEDERSLIIKAGLFYTGIIAGCNCADDPTPVDENNEYCEALFQINKKTAETSVSIIN